MPPKGIGSGPKKKARKKPQTSRGPQGLPTQASSTQKPQTPKPRSRPAPKVQPGPIRQAERVKAERFKETPEYRESVRVARKTRPAKDRIERVERAERREREAARQKGQTVSREDRAILDQHRSEVARNAVLAEGRARSTGFSDTERKRVDEFKKTKTYKKALDAAKPEKDTADKVAGITAGVIGDIANQGLKLTPSGAGTSVDISKTAENFANTQFQTARAIKEDPGKVLGETARRVPGTAKATAAAVAEPFVEAFRKPTAKNIAKAAATPATLTVGGLVSAHKSLEERGKEAREQPKKYRARKKREGAIEEISDASMALPGAGAVVGRATSVVARTGALGVRAKRVAVAPRAKLRVRAGEGGARPQPKSRNFIVAATQDARDTHRARKFEKRKKAAERDEDSPIRGLVPAGEGEVVRRRLRKQNKDQRVSVAGDLSHGYVRLKSRQSREIHQGVEHERKVAKRKLNRSQKRAFDDMETLAERGLVNFDDPAKTREVLTKYKKRIETKRAEPGAKEPAKPSSDELARIDRVLEQIEDPVVRERMKGYHAQQVERQQRLREQDQTLDDATAEVRVHQPQGRVLGEADKLDEQIARIEAKREAGELTAEGAKRLADNARRQFVVRTKTRAKAEGLPDPVYVMDRPRRTPGYADYAAGGSKAMAGHKKSKQVLFDEGRADTTPDSYTQGLAKSIKRNVNWNTVADVHERNTPEWGRQKTVENLRQEIDKRNLDPREWRIVDMGVIRKARDTHPEGRADELNLSGDEGISKTISDATHKLDGTAADFVGTGRKFSLVPKAVADELAQQARPSGAALRTLQKVQGTTSRLILSTNPLYVPQQVVSQAAIGIPATKGRLLSGKGNRWYKTLDDRAKEAVDEWVGLSPARDVSRGVRYGAALDNKLVRGFHALVDHDIVQKARESKFNPLHWNFMIDEKQNALFRRELLYDSIKRQQTKDMTGTVNALVAGGPDLVKTLEMPDGPQKIAALRRAEPQLELAAQRVDDLLGNWTTYTARERKLLRSSFLFYGFLRWATKFTFYTMPVKHPIVTGMLAKIGEMQAEEVVDLLGDQFLASPEGKDGKYTREEIEEAVRKELLSQIGGRVYYVRDGKLAYFDAAKVNPFSGPVMDSLSDPGKASFGLVSPVVQSAINAVWTKENTGLGAPLNTKGAMTEYGREAEVGPNETGRIIVRNLVRMVPALRLGDEAATGKKNLGDDSLPFVGDREVMPRTEKQAKKIARRIDAKAGTPAARAGEAAVGSAYRANDATINERVRGAANFPKLQKLEAEVGRIERGVRAANPKMTNEQVRAIAYRTSKRYGEAKDEIARLSVRGGIRPAPKKKARKKSSALSGSGGLGSGALSGRGALGGS